MNTVGKQLRELRIRAGLSLEQAAQAMGLARASSAQHYEDDFKKACLPLDKVTALAKVLVGRGSPPITEDEVFMLAGGDPLAVRRVFRRAQANADHLTLVSELDGAEETQAWGFPETWLRHVLAAQPHDLRVVAVQGDSMAPIAASGDRLLVNASLTSPSPPGVFVIRQGSAAVPIRLALIPNSDPLSVRLSCDNPQYPSFDLPLSDIEVMGRVVALLHKL